MENIFQEYRDRKEKIVKLKKSWIIVYANHFHGKQDIREILQTKEIGDAEDYQVHGVKKTFCIAGRLMSYRKHGKIAFWKILDATWSIQICFVDGKCLFFTWRETVDAWNIDWVMYSAYEITEKFIDRGDFIGVWGDLFYTKHGELTLFVWEFQILAKSLRPLPEKFHGIQDQELLYRYRYLDLIMNESTYERMKLKSKFLWCLRNFYQKEWFIEIETPILGNAASWAAAKPFVTYHEDFHENFFLRISPETALKKATVGRFEKVVEFARNFRNEGSDPSHIQEFTSIEHYAAWRNYRDNMVFTEKMFSYIFESIEEFSKEIVVTSKQGVKRKVSFQTPWEKINFVDALKEVTGIDVSQYTYGDEEMLQKEMQQRWFFFEKMETMGITSLIDTLYKKTLRNHIVWPAFVYNYPKIMQPLARWNDENENIVEQFQVVVNGWEIIKAYSELVDPEIQRENFMIQWKMKERGDEEVTGSDDDFLLAMEYGMPPQSWWGMGIERVFSLLTMQDNLRDVVLFPLMKSEKW